MAVHFYTGLKKFCIVSSRPVYGDRFWTLFYQIFPKIIELIRVTILPLVSKFVSQFAVIAFNRSIKEDLMGGVSSTQKSTSDVSR